MGFINLTESTIVSRGAGMVKRIYIVFDNDEFEELKKRKERLGLSWPEVIRKGLECLEREAGDKGQG